MDSIKLPCTHDTSCPRDAQNMPGHRHRNEDGSLRKLSGAKHLGTLEEGNGEISRLPDDTHLKELRERTGEEGINKVIPAIKKQESICKVNTIA